MSPFRYSSACALFFLFTLLAAAQSPGPTHHALTQRQRLTGRSPLSQPAISKRQSNNFGSAPLHFEENVGQTGSDVRFLSRGPGYTLFLTHSEAVFVLNAPRTIDKNALAHRDRRKPRL